MRRAMIAAAVLVPLVAGCSGAESEAEGCGPVPPAGVTSSDGWLGRIHAEPQNISVLVDDGQGQVLARRAQEQQPVASATKVVALAAYARAVAVGDLDQGEVVPVAEWERWYLPGTDGGAHEQARARLGGDSVTLDQMVSAMVQESDNAVPDYLRDRLGDRALIEAAAAGGWDDYRPSSKLGELIRLIEPGGDEWETARRYANDPGYRASVQSKALPPLEIQSEWAETTGTASARQLSDMHRSIADGSFGSGVDIARAHLEWQPAPPGYEAIGFKGGALPGVLADAIYLRGADGTVATAVLLNRRMPVETWAEAVTTLSEQGVLVRAMMEPEMFRRLACVV
ncbi:serine hydrolase [Nocardia puris]|uniref:serine hydrolase n=1 Tax=Nocardia puris TaxID=208602 RepID=UPI0018947C63|nr:serine hydrolase [Nocardia puris]MBF6369633.1 serine hydrolase [Nocardia puris]MBF6462552.1 serine hydrolase [Nocardia puris]